MLKAFIKIWLVALLSQTEVCNASHFSIQGIHPGSNLFFKKQDALATGHLTGKIHSVQLFTADLMNTNAAINQNRDNGAGFTGNLIQLTGLFLVLTSLLVIVIFQWFTIGRFKSKEQKQQTELDKLACQLSHQQTQLEANLKFSERLFRQIKLHRVNQESFLTSLTDDIANPISVIQTSFIGWMKLSKLNDVMLEKARLIEKSVERIDRFLKRARFPVTPGEQSTQKPQTDIHQLLQRLSKTMTFSYKSVELQGTSTTIAVKDSQYLVEGDHVTIEFIITSIIGQLAKFLEKDQQLDTSIFMDDKSLTIIIHLQNWNDSNKNNELVAIKEAFVAEIAANSDIDATTSVQEESGLIQLRFKRSPEKFNNKNKGAEPFMPPVVFESSHQPVIHQDGPDPHSPKCLVIESSAEMQICIIQAMKEQFCCKGIFNSATATQQIRDWQPDIILAELQSNHSDGFNLVRELKNEPDIAATPILVLTNQGTTENKLKALELDVEALIEKPFSEELLIKTAIKATNKKQVSQNAEEIREHVAFQQSKDAIFLAQLNSLIEKHIGNSQFRFEDYFSQFTMSKRQFFRRVNTLTRCTPKQYLIQKRLELARHLLGKGILLGEVTQRCGFKDEQSFIKVYEAHFGEAIV